MQNFHRCDVAVVGAGPAGSKCAAQLAALGYEVLLLDRNPGTRKQIICTGITGAEAFAHFNLPQSSVLSALSRVRFHSPGGYALAYESERPFAYVVDRHRFDRALQQDARELGVRIVFGFQVEGKESRRGGIRLHGRVEGVPCPIEARVAVFATGSDPRMARALGLDEPVKTIHGVQAEASMDPLGDTEVYFGNRVAPGFFAWVVPIGPGRARVGLLAHRNGRECFERFLRSPILERRLAEYPATISSRRIVQGPLPTTVGDHFVVVGEAAGQVKTSTAGGIYYGLLGAELAAEVIDSALKKGRLTRPGLLEYHRRWTRILGPELRAGFRLQSLAQALSDAEIDWLFQNVGRNGNLSPLRQLVRFDWHRIPILFLFRYLYLANFLSPKSLQEAT